MADLSKELTMEMIPDGLYRLIAKEIGIENFVKLTHLVGGATIYIPKCDSVIRPIRDSRIKEEFNGYNVPALAKKYGVTERWVRILCLEEPLEGQMNLFVKPL